MLPSAPALAALNHLLSQADWARERLRPFSGKHACIAGSLLTLQFGVLEDGYVAALEGSAVADVEIIIPTPTPALLLAGRQAIIAGARISGPADFAEALGFVLRNLRWDFEEDLSRLVGDIPANRIAFALNGFLEWNRQAVANTAGNILEYLTEEQPSLVKNSNAKSFARETTALDDDLSGLEARIQRLTAARK